MMYTKNQEKFIELSLESEKYNDLSEAKGIDIIERKKNVRLFNREYTKLDVLVYKMYQSDNSLTEVRQLIDHENEWVSCFATDYLWIIYDDSLFNDILKFETSKVVHISMGAKYAMHEGSNAGVFRKKFFENYNKWLAKKK